MKKIFLNRATALIFMLGLSTAHGQVTTYDYSGSIETYTVPPGVESISIQAYGAQGGNDNGGLGAGIYGEFAVSPGDVFNIVVGQQGVVNNCGGPDASGGGGGGTFVWDPTDTALPIIAAGAGGGGNENWGDTDCRKGLPGQAGEDGTSGAEGLADGGIGGQGGDGDAPSGTGSGGGGWLSAGQNSTWGDGCTGGTTLPTFIPGNGSASFGPGGEGGFGGGGGAVCGCGGGGGYSGGAGGNGLSCRAGGGGGGSYNTGTAQTNVTGIRTGNGQVIITELCEPLTVSVSSYVLCEGEELTLDATSILGGAITWDLGVVDGEAFIPASTGVITYTASSDLASDCDLEVEIEVLERPSITYTTADEISGADGEINITVTGGTPAYLFDWDNDGTGDFDDDEDLTGLVAGSYIVEVQDDSGCVNTETIVVNSQVGISEIENTFIVLYPNPTKDKITVETEGEFNYTIFTIDGKFMYSNTAFNTATVSLKNYEQGVYLIHINADNRNKTFRLIKN